MYSALHIVFLSWLITRVIRMERRNHDCVTSNEFLLTSVLDRSSFFSFKNLSRQLYGVVVRVH